MDNNNATPVSDLDTLLASLSTGDETQAQSETAAVDGADAADEQHTVDTGTEQTETQPAANNQTSDVSVESLESTDNKTNKAFAQMRTQNKAYATVMQQMLTRMGVDPSLAHDPQKLQQLLSKAEVTQQAKAMQVPEELLQRVVQLEQTNKAQEAQRLQESALRGFKYVRDTYNLTDKELSDFARQLQEAGTNPFEKEIDLDMAYRTHNLQKIIDKATQKAVQEALSKQESAAKRSTAPTKSTGKPDSAKLGDDEINTMAQFDKMLLSI